MQQYFRSLAMIPPSYGDRSRWFGRWSEDRDCYDFIAGVRVGNESFRDCVRREVCNTLALQPKDILVANMAQLNLEYAGELPGTSGLQHVAVTFYIVHLYSNAARQSVASDSQGRWLTPGELLRGMTTEGRPISPTLTHLLEQSEVITSYSAANSEC